MDRATRAVRRSATKLICADESQGDLQIALAEFRNVKDAAKTFAEIQRNAGEFLLKWSLHEDNRAIKDAAMQFNELMCLWSDAQVDFATRIGDAADQMENILTSDKSVKDSEKYAMQMVEKELKLRKEVKKALKWKKGGDVRLLELKLNETTEARQLAERQISEIRVGIETSKMIRFKCGMIKMAEAYLNMATSCGIIFEAQHDISRRMPDPSDNVPEMQYSGSMFTRERVEMARMRLSSLQLSTTSGTAAVAHHRQRRSDPGRFPQGRSMSVPDPPPPYCQFDPHQSSSVRLI